MEEYRDYVIFFLDILGFKEIIDNNRITVDEMLNKFDKAEYHLDYTRWINKRENDEQRWIDNEEKNYLQVSDSIVLSFPIETPSGLFYSILDVMRLQANFAALHGIFLRGACTYGKLYHKGTTIFGPAMNKVVSMEKVAKYPRVIIPNKVITECSKYSSNFNYRDIDEKKDITHCLKMDKDGYFYIDYISYDTFGHETDSNEEWADYIIRLKERIQDGLYEQVALDKYMWLKEKYNNAITDNIIKNYREKDDIILSRIE